MCLVYICNYSQYFDCISVTALSTCTLIVYLLLFFSTLIVCLLLPSLPWLYICCCSYYFERISATTLITLIVYLLIISVLWLISSEVTNTDQYPRTTSGQYPTHPQPCPSAACPYTNIPPNCRRERVITYNGIRCRCARNACSNGDRTYGWFKKKIID